MSDLKNLLQILYSALQSAPLLLGHVSLSAHCSTGLSQLFII